MKDNLMTKFTHVLKRVFGTDSDVIVERNPYQVSIDELECEVDALKKENRELDLKNKMLENQVERYCKQNRNLKTENKALQERLGMTDNLPGARRTPPGAKPNASRRKPKLTKV